MRGTFVKMANIQTSKYGVFMVRRVVPLELRSIIGKTEVKKSLQTTDRVAAMVAAIPINREIDEAFEEARRKLAESQLDWKDRVIATSFKLSGASLTDVFKGIREDAVKKHIASSSQGMTLKTALKLYLKTRETSGQRSEHDRQRFERERTRIVDTLIAHLDGEDRQITNVSRIEARSFTDKLQADYSAGGANKQLGFLKAMFTTALREIESTKLNPFDGLRVEEKQASRELRRSFTTDEITTILSKMQAEKDVYEWKHVGILTALTGTRLAEIVGLDASDVKADAKIPHIIIRPNAHRTLKNRTSTRTIPMVGPMAAIFDKLPKEGAVFPKYIAQKGGFDSASKDMSRFLRLKAKIDDGLASWHSWRHTLKDLMRNSGVPDPLSKEILGHAQEGMSGTYGEGHSLAVQKEALEKALKPLIKALN